MCELAQTGSHQTQKRRPEFRPGRAELSLRQTTSNSLTSADFFRASKEQISQAQTILKQRRLYVGDPTGKLDAETRAGLKRFQEAEGLKTTGTLNRATLEKMNIPLTERQRTM